MNLTLTGKDFQGTLTITGPGLDTPATGIWRGRLPDAIDWAASEILYARRGTLALAPGGTPAPPPEPPPPPPTPSTWSATQQEMLDQLNLFRISQRIPRVTGNAALMRAAQEYAELMQRTGHFSHTGPDGSTPGTRATAAGYRFLALAENIAAFQQTPGAAQTAWEMSRQGHREAMLGTLYTEAGCGSAGYDPRGAGPYWVMLLGRPR